MLLSVLQEKAREQKLPLAIVVAEALHLIALDALFSQPESLAIGFQGGTSIHLLHVGYRYSEYLDFAGEGLDYALAYKLVSRSQSIMEKLAIQVLGRGACSWRLPSPAAGRQVYAFWFYFQPSGQRQRFRVKMEFARYPVYEPQVLAVRSELDVLNRLSLVQGLSARELLAEKVSAVAGRPYVKGRDLFDLWYLSEVLRVPLELSLLEKKLRDYRVMASASKVKGKLSGYKPEALTAEMERFLPVRYRNQLREHGYDAIRRAALKIVEQASVLLRGR